MLKFKTRLAEIVNDPSKITYEDYVAFEKVQKNKRLKVFTIVAGAAASIIGLGLVCGALSLLFVMPSLSLGVKAAIALAGAIPGGVVAAVGMGTTTAASVNLKVANDYGNYEYALKNLKKEDPAEFKLLKTAMKNYSKTVDFQKARFEAAKEKFDKESMWRKETLEKFVKGEAYYAFLAECTRNEIDAAKYMNYAAKKLEHAQVKQKRANAKAEREQDAKANTIEDGAERRLAPEEEKQKVATTVEQNAEVKAYTKKGSRASLDGEQKPAKAAAKTNSKRKQKNVDVDETGDSPELGL